MVQTMPKKKQNIQVTLNKVPGTHPYFSGTYSFTRIPNPHQHDERIVCSTGRI